MDGPHRGWDGPGKFGDGDGGHPLMAPGRWWKRAEVAKALGLDDAQIQKIEQIFQDSRLKLVDLHASLEKEEIKLEPMIEADNPDETAVMGAIDRIAAGRAALADTEHQRAARAHNDRYLPWLAETLGRSNRLHLYPSQSNFQLIDFPTRDAVRDCTAHLAANGILVRHFGPGAHERQMRISIGNGPALERAAALITEFLEQGD